MELSKQQQSKVQATQMNVLRRIKGVSRLEWKIRMEEMHMERTTKKILKDNGGEFERGIMD